MSKRHYEDYNKHGSSQSSRKDVYYEDAKRTKHHDASRESHRSSSDEETAHEKKESSNSRNKHNEFNSAKSKFKSGIQIKLGPPKSAADTKPLIKVASVFSQDSDEEPEEMPKEARMKMRNIGRDTPTSAGPNSFGKTKQGFCHAKRVFEKSVEQALENLKD